MVEKMEKNTTLKALDAYKLTKFQKKVLIATFNIPKGETRSYKQIAVAAGYPNAFRAVGSVMKINPLAPKIPCHRVVKSSGEIGNYSGKGGKLRKLQLLRHENAKIVNLR